MSPSCDSDSYTAALQSSTTKQPTISSITQHCNTFCLVECFLYHGDFDVFNNSPKMLQMRGGGGGRGRTWTRGQMWAAGMLSSWAMPLLMTHTGSAFKASASWKYSNTPIPAYRFLRLVVRWKYSNHYYACTHVMNLIYSLCIQSLCQLKLLRTL